VAYSLFTFRKKFVIPSSPRVFIEGSQHPLLKTGFL
jgi:hypothetical protein